MGLAKAGSNKSSKEQAAISRQQLQLEQERLELEKQAAAQRAMELAKIQEQMDLSSQAYQAQLSFMQQQQQAATAKQEEFAKILSNLTSLMGRGEMEAEYERRRAEILGQQEADETANKLGLLSSNIQNQTARNIKKKQQAVQAYNQPERRSIGLLSGEGVPR